MQKERRSHSEVFLNFIGTEIEHRFEHKPLQNNYLKNKNTQKNLNINSNLPSLCGDGLLPLMQLDCPHNSRFEFSQYRAAHQVSI